MAKFEEFDVVVTDADGLETPDRVTGDTKKQWRTADGRKLSKVNDRVLGEDGATWAKAVAAPAPADPDPAPAPIEPDPAPVVAAPAGLTPADQRIADNLRRRLGAFVQTGSDMTANELHALTAALSQYGKPEFGALDGVTKPVAGALLAQARFVFDTLAANPDAVKCLTAWHKGKMFGYRIGWK